MKYTKWNEENLEMFFQDNCIEDDDLFNLLKGREAILEMDTAGDGKKETELTIKMRMTD